ncbi:hypothetical protein [Chryseobacterium polytrichastri]|uniref:Uncharacterized protein n=1 Tax=Chryseobacterium polytrichastri TaxID=1302687 RepID=A0A1M6QWL7_9FLAO|nr:hypothetical protein [Chryseobacterium polytrichastri]SHK24513.1 hypothetical protein SAMN05444267_1002113 [Chryseobacterium polytrichastri]
METGNSIGDYKPGRPSINHTMIYNENIVVVGAEVHDKKIQNKLMFMAQAIRRVKISSVQTVIYFKQGYSSNMIIEFEKSLKNYKKDIKILSIHNISELFNYINTGYKTKGNDYRTKPDVYGNIYKVKNIYIYSHGLPSKITFLLDWDLYKEQNKIASNETAQANELNLKNYKLISQKVFNDASIYSFACRTGINEEDSTDVELLWGDGNSLAQNLANYLKIDIYGYARRSNYEETWGNWADRRLLNMADFDEKIFPKERIKYDDEFRDYKSKEIFLDDKKYPWQPQGAYRDVKAGDTPKGPPQKLLKYTFKE